MVEQITQFLRESFAQITNDKNGIEGQKEEGKKEENKKQEINENEYVIIDENEGQESEDEEEELKLRKSKIKFIEHKKSNNQVSVATED